jgi:diadenosine hexaphosphate hydrolase (ATP-forming)
MNLHEGQEKVKNEHNETLKAGCVVVNENNQLLLVSLKGENIWNFPKGHMEPGEVIEKAAIREVAEETGYAVEIINPLPDITYTNQKTGELIRVKIFQAKPVKKITEPESHTESGWFSIDEARELLWHNLKWVIDELALN